MHSGNYDTFIFFIEDMKLREKIIQTMSDYQFGTKILPDALKWHCSSYWGHAINDYEVAYSEKTLNYLKRSVGVPILLKREISDYSKLGNAIIDVIKET